MTFFQWFWQYYVCCNKHNDILELQSLLEHNDFDNKPTIKITITMLMFSTSTIQRRLKYKNNQVIKY